MKKCKLLLALSVLTCLLTLMCLSANAATYSGTCGDNLTWSLDTDTGVLEISGTGAMEDYSSSSAPWYSCRDYVKTVTIGDGITCIGDNAFYNCRSLTSVTIGDSVTSIGSHAFFFCSSLTSVTIPFGVTSIGVSAFCYCSSLTSATISDSVTSIATSVFLHCTSLETISVDENNAAYSSDEYGVLFNKDKTQLIQYPTGNTGNAYIIPSSVTSIDCNAFYNCRSLTSVTIGDSVTSIGTYAFGECSSLETISVDGNNSAVYGKVTVCLLVPI